MSTATATHRYIGLTDDTDTCAHCGKQNLKRVVVLALLDADGNDEEITYYGTTCAARALNVHGGGRRVAELASYAQQKTVAEANNARELLAHYGVDPDGTITHRYGFDGVVMDYEVQYRGGAWVNFRALEGNPVRPAEWRQMARDMIARRTAQIAEAALIGA